MGLKIKSPSTSYLGSLTKPSISNASGLTVHSLSTVYLGSAVDPESGGGSKEKFIYGINGATILLPNINDAYKFHFKGIYINELFIKDLSMFYFVADTDTRNYIFRFLGRQYGNRLFTEIWNYRTSGGGTSVLLEEFDKTTENTPFDIEYNLDNICNLKNLTFLLSNWNFSYSPVRFSLFEIFDSNNNVLLSVYPNIVNDIKGVTDSVTGNFYTNINGTLEIE